MPRKKKKASELEDDTEIYPGILTVLPEQPASPDLTLEPSQPDESDHDKAPLDPSLELVKVKVKTGTLSYEEGTFQKGTIFYVSKKRAALFDPNDIQVLG